jgi:F-type H+-transporting ATPase subunit b
MPQLDFLTHPFASQLFWLFLSFGFLYIIFSKSVLPRITNIKTRRNDAVKLSLDEANRLKEEASNTNEASDKALKDAKAKAESMINKALSNIKKLEEDAFNRLNLKLEEEKKSLLNDIETYKKTLSKESSNITNDLVDYILKNNFNLEIKAQEISNITKAIK